MISFKLAFRNLLGAGLRTWLNVFVLSISFIVIIFLKGFIEGWNRQARRDTIEWEIGGGQYWHQAYDPFDPFTFADSHGPLPAVLEDEVREGRMIPILISQASIYPEGRMQNVLLRGIQPDQALLRIPTAYLREETEAIPAVIGTRMAKNNHLNVGDYVTVRWRDVNGTFDARDAKIVQIMKTNVGSIDIGQMWIPLDRLRDMLRMPGEATLLVTDKEVGFTRPAPGWIFKDHAFLLKEIEEMIRMKSTGQSVLYIILLFLALLAIFDTQVFSIFRRRKEIGTLIALGMTRARVIRLFTIEGAMHGLFAALMACLYGIPLLYYFMKKGMAMPEMVDDYGMTIAETIFPAYSIGLIAGTTFFVLLSVTVVSFLPVRKISKLKPTDAIRGKLQ